MSEVFELMILVGGGLTAMVLFIPIYAIWLSHKRGVEEIRARAKVQVAEETRKAIAEIREEFKALRDTTTEYDLSFDTALKRIESRVSTVEQRVGSIERGSSSMSMNRV